MKNNLAACYVAKETHVFIPLFVHVSRLCQQRAQIISHRTANVAQWQRHLIENKYDEHHAYLATRVGHMENLSYILDTGRETEKAEKKTKDE